MTSAPELASKRIWFDTEFIEDGNTVELVSIGMVRDDGATYYAEVNGVDYSRADPWLHANVFPHLQGGAAVKSREMIRAEILAFAGERPEFWAYYADYDWVALCQLYGRMIDLPKGWPMFCRDLKQEAGAINLPKQTAGIEHHALRDALWTRDAHRALDAARRAPVAVSEAMGRDGCARTQDGDNLSIEDMWQRHLDRDDRNSPEEYPDMALITFEEFRDAIMSFLPAKPVPGNDDPIIAALSELKI